MPKKILLADDSLTIQKVVELTLAGRDYELTCMSNGHEALESLQQSRPDLILADVVMPEKNGYEVCEAVKSNPATARIPVILLSGVFEPFDRDRADRIGADRVVSKPFDAQQLLDLIETLLTRAASASPSAPARPEEGPFETAFPDGPVATAGPADRSEAIEAENPFEASRLLVSPSLSELASTGPEDGQNRLADSPSEAPTKEEASAEAGEGGSTAETALDRVTAFFAAPVSPHSWEMPATSQEPETLRPAEEISAGAAEILFDVPAVAAPAPTASPAPAVPELTDEQIERIATLVVAKLSDRVLREIAWKVVPDVAEMVVKRRIEELESGAG